MKKTLTLTTLALLGGAVSVFAQGQVGLGDGPDSGGSFGIQIFGPQAGSTVVVTAPGGATGLETMGNSGDDLNATVYGHSYNTSPGSANYAPGSALGAGYDVQLLAGSSASSLAPVGPVITTWYPGAGAHDFGGFWQANGNATIPGIAPGATAVVEIAAWDASKGSTLAAVIAAGGGGWGVSLPGTTTTLGGGILTPPSLPSTIESFSLISVPEPSTIALGVIGASTLLFRRRK